MSDINWPLLLAEVFIVFTLAVVIVYAIRQFLIEAVKQALREFEDEEAATQEPEKQL